MAEELLAGMQSLLHAAGADDAVAQADIFTHSCDPVVAIAIIEQLDPDMSAECSARR